MLELAPPSDTKLTYNDAILYCQFCNHNGRHDWRMITWKEYKIYFANVRWSWFLTQDVEDDAVRFVVPVRDI